ncbi:response regulator transcription factor [Marinicella gelatinilytica]|uniref:response regulator transcription factor n=1 Tax=Marinicella gelatinilytica TaxID=2996017 RepID=UPI002260BB8F|nr:response regulator [Marinicella gelatinilytica]MCX7545423.1 response regulator [Marinicella gelatinilytica]
MKTLLIVDDDQVLRATLKRVMSRYHHVYEAADSHSALAICKQHRIHRALVDLKLGEESGLVLTADLLNHDPTMHIVVMTGYASIATAINAIKLGAINYLTKPVSTEEILYAFNETRPGTDIDNQTMSPKRLEWEHIQRVLQDHNGNITQTAKALNMHRRTLQRKLQKKPVSE